MRAQWKRHSNRFCQGKSDKALLLPGHLGSMSFDQIRHAVKSEIVMQHLTWIHGRPVTFLVMAAINPAV
jgi:hypothetical protein